MSIALSHADGSITVAEVDLDFLSEFLIDAQIGKVAFAYVTDARGDVLATSSDGPEVGKNLSALPQVFAVSKPGGVAPASGTDARGNAVLTTSSLVPKLGWRVFFEQETAQALIPIRDQLVRIALLIGLGLVVAIIAGTIMARRMLVPITALQAGARRLGAGDFGHRIEVKTSDELEELATQFNGMAGQLAETYSNLEAKVDERTRDLAQSINELKVLEEVGRAVASSLDLDAVLPTVAARALEITHADAVLIYGYDAGNHQFSLTESIGIDKAAEGRHRAIDADRSPLGEAATTGEPISIPQLDAVPEHPLRDVAIEAGFHSVLVVPLVDQTGILGSLVVLRRNEGEFSANLIGLMKTFAHQAVLAMRNARLFTEVDHKSRELLAANDTVRQQAGKLQEQTDQLKDWNRSLEERVETQLGEIERIRRLERFLAPQVAQLIASSDGHEGLLDSHRREVTVVFCDMRGFTSFTETTEPEEAMNVLREYHAALGELIFKYEGTLDRYAGDGVMILFNAPIQFEDHTARAVRMAVEMRDTVGQLTEKWRNRGHNLGFGIGIALGYATLGQIGFEQRLEYAAIGSVTNLASRLCDEAKANQIVVSRRVYGMVEQWVEGKPIDDLNLKGFNHPILAAEITGWREAVDNVVDAARGGATEEDAIAAHRAPQAQSCRSSQVEIWKTTPCKVAWRIDGREASKPGGASWGKPANTSGFRQPCHVRLRRREPLFRDAISQGPYATVYRMPHLGGAGGGETVPRTNLGRLNAPPIATTNVVLVTARLTGNEEKWYESRQSEVGEPVRARKAMGMALSRPSSGPPPTRCATTWTRPSTSTSSSA